MKNKKKILIIAAAVILLAFAAVYKIPKGIDDILIYPFHFNENGGYNCFGGIPYKLRMYFPPDEGNPGYEEISEILKEAEFVPDFRNIAPIKDTFPKLKKSGSSIYIDDYDSVIVIEFQGSKVYNHCDVSIYNDGTVSVQTFEYHDVVYSYRLKNLEIYEKLWNYIEENGSVFYE